jgi:hypothetical protein
MKYGDLIQFEPINEVVKFSRTNEIEYQKNLIKTFVFSKTLKESLIPLMVRNLNYHQPGETFGLQVVGNYGTGKSHLMSLVSLIAENESLADLVQEENAKSELLKIAGKFKVLRFELGHTESLWEVMKFKLSEYLGELNVDFSFDGHGSKSYFELIQLMMSEFESKYQDQGLLIVVDEMLAYLKSRSTPDKLNSDLQVLQALGQACDNSRFKFIFGVQELIYQSSEFQFAAEMLQKVNDRYKDIQITKEDVAFIVKNRLLKKNEHQKQEIRNHLDKFQNLFIDLHARTEDYVELFPVHPTYFENFEKIKIGKSQREILKTLSNQFKTLLDKNIPSDNPGLLTYDQYWEEIQCSQDLMSIPDVRRVKDISDTIKDKIETFFTGPREVKRNTAVRINNAAAIKILQHELTKQNGTNTEHLVDDLCLTDKNADDREFLMDVMSSTADLIIKATSGQYFDKDPENGDYHYRIEGGINFDQKIKDYASQMTESMKDEYFFKFLEVSLPLDYDTYRSGFKIWQHSIEWKENKAFREGYIFFGNPNEKSTTQPRQHFYMYFMPIFDFSNKIKNHETDEVYFDFDGLSDEFKENVSLYGAAQSLLSRADTSQKPIYQQKIQDLQMKCRNLFEQEYLQITTVDYCGEVKPIKAFTLPGAGATKEQIFSDITSAVLSEWFNNENPNYPKFSQLNQPLTKENLPKLIKQGITKIINPDQANREGEGVLSALGLWVPGMLDISHSIYANSLLNLLKEKGDSKVLNRDEVIECVHQGSNMWLTVDYKIEAELELLVMATLVALGEIEFTMNSGTTVNASNLNVLRDFSQADAYNFATIRKPKDINELALRALFLGFVGRDLTKLLKEESTYISLTEKSNDWASRTVRISSQISNGLMISGVEILTLEEAAEAQRKLSAFSSFCDKVSSYNNAAKIKNFAFSVDEVNRLLESKTLIESIEQKIENAKKLSSSLNYLMQCKQYITDSTLKTEVQDMMNKISVTIQENDFGKTDALYAEAGIVKEKYASWYLKQYLEFRISESDNTLKSALLDSEDKFICDELHELEFITTGGYNEIIQTLNQLQPADPKVNKGLIMDSPYHDFNPVDYSGKAKVSIKSVQEKINLILEDWTTALKDCLEDPGIAKNLSLLSESDTKLLTGFQNGSIPLKKDNVRQLKQLIITLYKGLVKIELTTESLKTSFNKPLTPDEAIDAFKKFIDQQTQGKDRNNVRIILK